MAARAVDAPLIGRCAPGKINLFTANIAVPYFSVGRRALYTIQAISSGPFSPNLRTENCVCPAILSHRVHSTAT